MKTPPLPLPTLRRLAELRDAGESLRAIAKTLETEGVPPPPRAQGWNHSRVQAALQQLEAWEAEAPAGPPAAEAPAPQQPSPRARPAATPAQVAIKIQGPWIKSDGLLWEFLLHEVWDDLGGPHPTHTLPISEAVRGLRGHGGRDRAALCAALDRLARSCVVLTGVRGERLVNVTTALLSSSAGTETVTFQFPAAVLKMVKNPPQYVDLQELLAAKS